MSVTPFKNEPYVDFNQPGPAEAMRKALNQVRSELGRSYPIVIGGETVSSPVSIKSVNPANPQQLVGEVAQATPEMTVKALATSWKAYRDWRNVPGEVRARYLLKAAAIMRRRIYEFSAWMVFESSKSWIEAYADTAEAIDFMEFYAREMIRLGGSQPTTPYPGEETEVRYIPLGAGVVIAPWNFPLAILCGMTTAALVTGNTVIMKPAEQTPVIAAKLFELLQEVSLPPGVVNFLPGYGDVGAALVQSAQTRFISFTGSREVGLEIWKRAAEHQPGQKWLKRCILEMGGKDAVLVDEGVDVEMAGREAAISAFGFQGQKCSAGSRLIVHEKVYDQVLESVIRHTKTFSIGDPTEDNVYNGAVIDEDAYNKINSYIQIGKSEGRLVYQGEKPEGGYFVPNTIFADVDRNARIAQEEIFGPVLAVIKAKDFDDLLEIANGTEYGLTGALISNNRAHLERARAEYHVGNLYLNRKCTGALVDVQPFGGFNMSGTDSKAGGRDYLNLFLQAKSISERL